MRRREPFLCWLRGHYWVNEPIITLRDTRYCKRCGVRPG